MRSSHYREPNLGQVDIVPVDSFVPQLSGKQPDVDGVVINLTSADMILAQVLTLAQVFRVDLPDVVSLEQRLYVVVPQIISQNPDLSRFHAQPASCRGASPPAGSQYA